VPHWGLDAGMLNRLVVMLRRAIDAAGGIEDADDLRKLARAVALLERMARGDRELRYAVDELAEALAGRISAAVLAAQGVEPQQPAALATLVDALALIDGALPPEGS
jgi:hypothetical protein